MGNINKNISSKKIDNINKMGNITTILNNKMGKIKAISINNMGSMTQTILNNKKDNINKTM
jgi:hypothetical protein